jgi:hypothetical protein
VQDVLVDSSPQGLAALKGVSSLTIRGTLSYQIRAVGGPPEL